MKYAVGIDVGGTNTRVALINEEYKILERIKFSTDSKDPEVTLQKIGEIIKGFAKEIEGIGISCPGPLDLIGGVVLTPPNLPGWHYFVLTERFIMEPKVLDRKLPIVLCGEMVQVKEI